jgi:hypothetical protein
MNDDMSKRFDEWSELQELYCADEIHAPSVKSIAVSFAKHASRPAQGTPEPPTLYVISATGDGAHTRIVPESQLKDALHESYCSCGKGRSAATK